MTRARCVYLRQLATKSGIWFCDVQRPDDLGHALDGWYTPEGLTALLKRDEKTAHEQLQCEPFNYGFALQDLPRLAERVYFELDQPAKQDELLTQIPDLPPAEKARFVRALMDSILGTDQSEG